MSDDQLLSFDQTVTRTGMYSRHCCLAFSVKFCDIKFVIMNGNVFNLFSVTIIRDKGFVVLCLVFLNYKRKDEGANNIVKLQEFKLLCLVFKTLM